jgi:hypothetical protein
MNILVLMGWLLTSNWFATGIAAFFYDLFSKER